MRFRLLLGCLVLYFVAKASLYALGVPPWQAPDETLHFEVAELRHRAGPGLGRLRVDPYLEEDVVTSLGHHDFWRLTGQIEPDIPPRTLGSSLVRHALPLYYNLVALSFAAAPSGAILSHLYAGRFISVVLGTLSVVFIALAGYRLFREEPVVVAGAVGTIAFIPQVGYMAGTLNSDLLVLALASAGCWLGVRTITGTASERALPFLVLVGLLCLMTKRNLYFLVPLLLLCPLLAVGGGRGRLLWWIAAVGVALLVFALGPVRTAATRSLHQAALHLQLVEEAPPGWWNRASLAFYRSFWASLGWLRLHAAWGWYQAAGAVLLAGLVGLSAMAVRWSWGKLDVGSERLRALVWLALVVCLGAVQVLLGLGLSGEELPQGRHLFPSLPALCLLLPVGLRFLAPGRAGRAIVVAAMAFLAVFDVWVMWRVALPGFYL